LNFDHEELDVFVPHQANMRIIDAMARPEHYEGLRAAARETAIKRYDLNSVCLPQMISFLESV
jgi:hypothetical protein